MVCLGLEGTEHAKVLIGAPVVNEVVAKPCQLPAPKENAQFSCKDTLDSCYRHAPTVFRALQLVRIVLAQRAFVCLPSEPIA